MNLINLTMQEIYSKMLPYLEHHKSTGHLFVAWLHKQLKETLAIQLFTIAMDLMCETDDTKITGNQRTSVGNQPASKQPKMLIHVWNHRWGI